MVKSMTGYASVSESGKWGLLVWEIRSVNHRYLDVSVRVPEAFRKLEMDFRKLVAQKIGRGKVECNLKYQQGEAAETKFTLNTVLVKQLAAAVKETNKHFDKTSAVNPLHVLGWNNVLQVSDAGSDDVNKKVLTSFAKAVDKLSSARKKEGVALKKVLQDKLQLVDKERVEVQKILPQVKKNYRQMLQDRLQEVSEKVDSNRLEQEMVYFAQKIDVEEELDRIKSHVEEAKKIIKHGGVVGKRLDFFMQELNREANTLASKSADKRITHSAVELKILIEQMREQIQNIE